MMNMANYKAAWENLKNELKTKANEKYLDLYAMMLRLEPAEFYFPIKDLELKDKPWLVAYAEKNGDEWSVEICKHGWSPCPVQYASFDEISDKYPCISDETRTMVTSDFPNKEALIHFAKKIYKEMQERIKDNYEKE